MTTSGVALSVFRRARPHRHLQPQLLRKKRWSCGCTRSSRPGEDSARTCHPGHLEGSVPDIRNFEALLVRNGIAVRKFFLHVPKKSRRNVFSKGGEPTKN